MTSPNRAVSRLRHDPAALVWAREAKGWRQYELARAAHISPGHMSEIEGGTRSATPAILRRIAEALNCPVSMLEAKPDNSTPRATVTRIVRTRALAG